VLGRVVEENFMNSVIKANGEILPFFDRPIAGILGVLTIVVWGFPLLRFAWRSLRGTKPVDPKTVSLEND
jgi:putative tricarboxylic transport membrane protein